jgi:hypothetical protein
MQQLTKCDHFTPYEISGGQSGPGAGFRRILWFTLANYHPINSQYAPMMMIIIIVVVIIIIIIIIIIKGLVNYVH